MPDDLDWVCWNQVVEIQVPLLVGRVFGAKSNQVFKTELIGAIWNYFWYL